jgi:hypothetical protein
MKLRGSSCKCRVDIATAGRRLQARQRFVPVAVGDEINQITVFNAHRIIEHPAVDVSGLVVVEVQTDSLVFAHVEAVGVGVDIDVQMYVGKAPVVSAYANLHLSSFVLVDPNPLADEPRRGSDVEAPIAWERHSWRHACDW